MNRILLPVKHYLGRHCASTALCNMVNFHGITLSETGRLKDADVQSEKMVAGICPMKRLP